MAFNNVEANINHLKSQKEITADDVMDSLNRFFDDAESFNRERGINELPLRNIVQYSLSLQDILVSLSFVYEKNKNDLKKLRDEDLTEAIRDKDEMQKSIKDKTDILLKIKDAFDQKQEAEQRINKLQRDIDDLQEKLDRIKNISEAELIEKKKELEKEISVREKKQIEKSLLEENLKKEKISLDSVSHDVEKLEKEKRVMENNISDFEEKVKDLKDWIEVHTGQENDETISKITKYRNTLTEIKSAFSSAKSDPEFPEMIGSSIEDNQFGESITSFKDLEAYFNDLSIQIERLIELYSTYYMKILNITNR